jgi:hypothetical protein
MSAKHKTVPVVTYTLLPEFERKVSNKKRVIEHRAIAKRSERALEKAKEENDKRLAEKKIRYERKNIPFSYLKEKIEKRNCALVEKVKQKTIERDNLREARDRAYRLMRFQEEISLARVVPIEIKKLPALFEKSKIGKAELLTCEKLLVPVLSKFAKTIGFDVEVDDFEEMTALVLRKPFPYWHYAYSGKK